MVEIVYPAPIANMTIKNNDPIHDLVLDKQPVQFTRRDVEAWCISAITSLNALIAHNENTIKQAQKGIIVGDTCSYFCSWRNSFSNAKRRGNAYLSLYTTTFSQAYEVDSFLRYTVGHIEGYNRELEKGRALAEDILQRMQQGKKFIKNSHAVQAQQMDGVWRLVALTREESVRCSECGAIIAPEKLTQHQKTNKCRDQAELKRLKDLGHNYTDDHRLKQGIQEGVVPGKMVPSGYHYYIPKWVKDAIALYDKDQGYAAMDLTEFIEKMRPESEKQ